VITSNLGRRYNRTKKQPEEAGALKGKGVDKMSTASALAAEHGVSPKNVRRSRTLPKKIPEGFPQIALGAALPSDEEGRLQGESAHGC